MFELKLNGTLDLSFFKISKRTEKVFTCEYEYELPKEDDANISTFSLDYFRGNLINNVSKIKFYDEVPLEIPERSLVSTPMKLREVSASKRNGRFYYGFILVGDKHGKEQPYSEFIISEFDEIPELDFDKKYIVVLE